MPLAAGAISWGGRLAGAAGARGLARRERRRKMCVRLAGTHLLKLDPLGFPIRRAHGGAGCGGGPPVREPAAMEIFLEDRLLRSRSKEINQNPQFLILG